jgi:hypothetical protein
MAAAVAFQAALARIGFNDQSVEALEANGIDGVRDLINLSDKVVEQILKIIWTGPPPLAVPYLAQKRLNIFCFWATRRNRLNENINPALFTQAAMEEYGAMMNMVDTDEENIVKAPAEYKTGSKWKAFKEGAIAYLNGVKGRHDIPLAYIIRDNEVPIPNQVYMSEHQRLIEVTPLQGVEYEDDNGKVFDLLKSWTINGPAWTWMRAHNATRNRRQAWLALLGHFEGEAQRDRVKDQAYAAIAAAKYYGECKKFMFETYVTIHQDAYADIEQYGEVISEEKRVCDLLTNIKDSSPAANAAKGTILATPTLWNNFSNAVAHLSTTLQLGQSLQETSNISSTQTGTGTPTGRGRGRGGGRGRGRGRGRNIYLGSYSYNDWKSLSSEDKKKVIEGRAKSSAASAAGNTNQGGGRQVASLATIQEDGMSTVGPTNTTVMEQAILQGTLQGSSAVGEKRGNAESAGSQMLRRRINAIISSRRTVDTQHRNISRMTYKQYTDHQDVITGTCELDSHADTCVAGSNCVVIEETHQKVDVSAFSEHLDTLKNVPIVTAATAYDDPVSGTTYILILGQAIYMGDTMQHSLICPNQLCARGLVVKDCPKHLSPIENPSSHSIYDADEDFRLPLSLWGVTSYFTTRTPTLYEIKFGTRIRKHFMSMKNALLNFMICM